MEYEEVVDHLPALRARRAPSITHSVDLTRRFLWRAFQHGELTDDEFARTLEQLEPAWTPRGLEDEVSLGD